MRQTRKQLEIKLNRLPARCPLLGLAGRHPLDKIPQRLMRSRGGALHSFDHALPSQQRIIVGRCGCVAVGNLFLDLEQQRLALMI